MLKDISLSKVCRCISKIDLNISKIKTHIFLVFTIAFKHFYCVDNKKI